MVKYLIKNYLFDFTLFLHVVSKFFYLLEATEGRWPL